MVTTKFEIERFNGGGDFTLWAKRIQAILSSQNALKAIQDPKNLPATMTEVDKQNLPATMTEVDKQSMEETTYEILILNITDNVPRQVINENTTYEIWEKLTALYDKKDLPSKLYMRDFSLKMNQSKTLNENLDEFKKLTNEFNQLGEKLRAESEAAIFINSLHDTYKEVKSTLKYGRESVLVDVVITALKSKELELQLEEKNA
ncbi:Retrovirus-related Pol polyprotein from transposon TNT 1-94 [Cucumis melo var. makuwa]|uniref:Retrovirus-related Pol polyprotein from transposon TNT 1-94 n=1 Tax=Cucumis melo var. makuwa TaxID=1194695 RepID=A0A5D3DWH4_CUCMM|nr:Retrovirus-related Pol polyprotein from transposon TNT 1-94 [Cucumis melo var. makuwa]